jgi:hypothetical protein
MLPVCAVWPEVKSKGLGNVLRPCQHDIRKTKNRLSSPSILLCIVPPEEEEDEEKVEGCCLERTQVRLDSCSLFL